METASLKDLLREHIELKGLTPKKIADLAGIPERYIDMLLEGDAAKLPPAPYVHGYITKLSAILNFDKETMWRLYQKESLLSRSGATDRLPNNRFASRTLTRTATIAVLVAGAVIAYGAYAAYGALMAPDMIITVPINESSEVAQPTIMLQGMTDPAYTVKVNGSEVYVAIDGSFRKELQLQEGSNTVEFTAQKFLGRETRIVRTIMYAPQSERGEKEMTEEDKPTRKSNGKNNATSTEE